MNCELFGKRFLSFGLILSSLVIDKVFSSENNHYTEIDNHFYRRIANQIGAIIRPFIEHTHETNTDIFRIKNAAVKIKNNELNLLTLVRNNFVKRRAKSVFIGLLLLSSVASNTVDVSACDESEERQRSLYTYKADRVLTEIGVVVGSRKPSCFVSYAWIENDERYNAFVTNLNTDLRKSGVETSFDQRHLSPGRVIADFNDRITSSNFVLMVLTPTYYSQSTIADTGIYKEVNVIKQKIRRRGTDSCIPLLYSGDYEGVLPEGMEMTYIPDFRDHSKYLDNLLTIFEQNIFTDLNYISSIRSSLNIEFYKELSHREDWQARRDIVDPHERTIKEGVYIIRNLGVDRGYLSWSENTRTVWNFALGAYGNIEVVPAWLGGGFLRDNNVPSGLRTNILENRKFDPSDYFSEQGKLKQYVRWEIRKTPEGAYTIRNMDLQQNVQNPTIGCLSWSFNKSPEGYLSQVLSSTAVRVAENGVKSTYNIVDYLPDGKWRNDILWDIKVADNGFFTIESKSHGVGFLSLSPVESASGRSGQVLWSPDSGDPASAAYQINARKRADTLWEFTKIG